MRKNKIATINNDTTRKQIAKLHLNTFYGIWGRSLDPLSTIVASPDQEVDIVSKYPVKNYIQVNEKTKIFLAHSNVDYNLIKQLNTELHVDLFLQHQQIIKSNVGIASAITGYARIEMMKYKSIPDTKVYYTDTDSIFVDKQLPQNMVGPELGQMKDELKGGVIKEAYFFGIKKYAYIDNNNKLTTVFSGVVRNSLTWKEIQDIDKNLVVKKQVPDQFFKSLNKLQIVIKQKTVFVKYISNKKLVDNKYKHIHINDITKFARIKLLYLKLVKSIKFILK